MYFYLVIAGTVVTAIIFAYANYKSRQPYEPGKMIQVPYLGVQFVAVVAIILMLAYLSSLMSS